MERESAYLSRGVYAKAVDRAYIARVSGEDSVTIRLRPRKFIEYHGRAGRTESG
jgi:hypothetical protein